MRRIGRFRVPDIVVAPDAGVPHVYPKVKGRDRLIHGSRSRDRGEERDITAAGLTRSRPDPLVGPKNGAVPTAYVEVTGH